MPSYGFIGLRKVTR